MNEFVVLEEKNGVLQESTDEISSGAERVQTRVQTTQEQNVRQRNVAILHDSQLKIIVEVPESVETFEPRRTTKCKDFLAGLAEWVQFCGNFAWNFVTCQCVPKNERRTDYSQDPQSSTNTF